MIINPIKVLDEGIVVPWKLEHPIDRELQLQPSGIDLRVFDIYKIKNVPQDSNYNILRLGQKEKIFPALELKGSYLEDEDKWIRIYKGEVYSVDFGEYVSLPVDKGALLFIRSTFNRCGIYTTTGWWDPGFKGRLSTTLHTDVNFELQLGTRLCQIVVIDGESSRLYSGVYQNTDTLISSSKS